MVYGLIAVAILVLDTIIKKHMVQRKEGQEESIVKGKLLLCYTKNYGFAFGTMEKYQKFIKGMMVAILMICSYSFWRLQKEKGKNLLKLGYAFLIGGGTSNFFDRLRKGYVVDYLIFPVKNQKLRHTVFNLSDLFIFAGGICLLVTRMLEKMNGKK